MVTRARGRSRRPPSVGPPVHLEARPTRSGAPSTSGSSGLPGLVVAHGAGSRASRHEAFCIEAQRQGFAVLAIDLRGHGDSDGSADGPLELDILAAADYLRHHPEVDPARIYYRGSSMGGFYGLKAATRPVFAAVALVCPASERDLLALFSDGAATTASTPKRPATARQKPAMRRLYRALPESTRDAGARSPLGPAGPLQPTSAARTQACSPPSHLPGLAHPRSRRRPGADLALPDAGRPPGHRDPFARSAGRQPHVAQHDPAVTAFTVQWLLASVAAEQRGRWSGVRGSNPRHSAWEADALPTELTPPGTRNKASRMIA